MNEISSISGSKKLISQRVVSLETTGQAGATTPSMESQQMEKLTLEMDQMQRAFVLMHEIRSSLEAALNNMSN